MSLWLRKSWNYSIMSNNKSSFDFYSLWEELFNENFKLAESHEFKNDSANNSFTMSPSRWISTTEVRLL